MEGGQPTAAHPGGVGPALLRSWLPPQLQGAGYDTVLVETVGLGQSEVAIAATADMVLLVVPPAGGDELQGVKKGIVEVADAVLVNKSDGALVPAARNAEAEYRRALQLVRPKHGAAWLPRVVRCSALAAADLGAAGSRESVSDTGGASSVADVWAVCEAFKGALGGEEGLAARRRVQGEAWMWSGFSADIVALARGCPAVQSSAGELAGLLGAGHVSPRAATRTLLRVFGAACAEAAVQVAAGTPADLPPFSLPHAGGASQDSSSTTSTGVA